MAKIKNIHESLIDSKIIGDTPEFQAIINASKVISNLDVTVLILGENGTGKEMIAQYVHSQSSRAKQAFIAVNCAAIPDSLLESELFGYRKGTFTNANQDYLGKIPAADKGTLFLDEIAELSLAAQAKLLRFIETQECQVLGQQHISKVDVRLIAATNKNLKQKVKDKEFREDLYYRLHIVPVEIPPLRERIADLPQLVKHFNQQFADKHQVDIPRYHKKTIKQLTKCSWKGNVRELRNFCERMVIFFPGKEIQVEQLPMEYTRVNDKPFFSNFVFPNEGIQLNLVEKSLITTALTKASGNHSKAARLLGITRHKLLYRIKKHQLLQPE